MLARWQIKRRKHEASRRATEPKGAGFGACHCAAGPGTMRKHRPYEGDGCWMCQYEKVTARLKKSGIKRRVMAFERVANGDGGGL